MSSNGRASNSSRMVRKRPAAAVEADRAADQDLAVVPAAPANGATRRRLKTAAEIDAAFNHENSKIGEGVRAQALFHEGDFDAAIVDVAPGAEFSENNETGSTLLYHVVGGEADKVEFKQRGKPARKLSVESEAIVDAGKWYTIANRSTVVHARVIAIVPQSSESTE
mmetsp:Transcript_60709/g.112633  ORF Transcript_60709/g.112633 Transcript_60709/m.112633 type:complete len:167 (+) Transcript_60709:50-550(+)